jgi:tetratricopeptide (TPR) repeat protein
MSKPMLVTLPFVLWLLDYWPLGRFVPGAAKRLVLEKLPFLGLAAACSIITYLVQKSGGAVSAATSLEGRLLNAVLSYGRYLGRMIWPRNLALIYPYTTQLPLVPLCGSVLVLIVLTWLVLKRREQRYLAMGWFWYLGTLAPVIGVVLAGAQSSADRFTYIPSIGIFVMIVWGVADLAAEWRLPAWGLVLAGASVLAACAVATEGQLRYWTDSGTLFSHTLDVTKDNYMSWNNLGVYLLSKGDQEGGFRCFTKAATVASDDYQSWYNLGTYYSKQGRKAEAWRCFNQSLRFRPNYIPARMSLADSLADAGKNAEAVSEYRQVLQSDPGDEHAHCNLACALAAQGQTAEALKELQQALRLNPSDASAHCNLGNLLIEQGKLEEAANEYRAALNSKPNSAEIHSNLGAVLALQGRREQAVDEFNQALRLAPDLMQAREGLKTLHGR